MLHIAMKTGKHTNTIYQRLRLMFAILVIGFTALASIHFTLHKLRSTWEHSSAQTRIQVNIIHHLSEHIKGVQTLYFLWPTIATDSQQNKIHAELVEYINQIFGLIRTLEYGGALSRELIPPDLAHKKNADRFTTLDPGEQLNPESIIQLRHSLQALYEDIEQINTLLQTNEPTTRTRLAYFQKNDSALFSNLYTITQSLIAETKDYLASQQVVITEKQTSYEIIEILLIIATVITIFFFTWRISRQLATTTNILEDTTEQIDNETKRHQALNAILAISMQKLSLQTQLNQSLDVLLEVISDKRSKGAGAIILAELKSQEISLAVTKGMPEALPCLTSFKEFIHCECGTSLQSGEICQAKNEDVHRACAHDKNYFCIPIGPQANPIGVLILNFAQQQLSQEDVGFLKFVSPILAGVILQSQYKQRLGNSELATLNIFQRSDQAIILIREDNIIDWNTGAAMLFKAKTLHEFPATHDLKKLLTQPPRPGEENVLQEHITKTLSEGVSHGELTLRKADDSSFLAALTFTTIPLHGEHIIYLVIQDVSAREEEKKALIQAKTAAEQASAAKSTFLTTMSHEILTPLNAILGITSLTLKNKLSKETKENLEIIRTSSQSLRALVIDILDISKIEADQFTASAIPFSLRKTLKEIQQNFETKATAQDILFHVAIDADAPDELVGDPGRLSLVLSKLIDNAFKYTMQGFVKCSISCKKKSASNCCILFTIQDSGIGIEEANLAKVFNDFTQINNSPTSRYGGAGLGLAISKKIVEKMGGTIWATSSENQGSNFYIEITFPLHQQLHSQDKAHHKKRVKNLVGKKILVVEDSPINLKVTSQTLANLGIETIFATNGEEALAIMHQDLDAIFMDVEMPVMDGLTATEHIRKNAAYDHIPIIAVTAHGTDSDKTLCLQAGMNDYMTKPIEPEVLLHVLNRNFTQEETALQSPIDYEQGIAKVGGDRAFFEEILQDFITIHGEEGELLLKLFQDKEFAEIKERAHRLKSVAGTISAKEFAEQAKRLEQLAGETPLNIINIEETIAQVQKQITRVLTTLSNPLK